jgi:RHS repeat-associated protein
MAGISDKAIGKIENKYKYNGIELDTALGINEYEAQLRDLDPQIGRWWQVDPETEDQEIWSPYTSNNDNPILYKDPRGNEGEACCGGLLGKVYDYAVKGATWINENLNPLTPIAEVITGKSIGSNLTEDKPRLQSAAEGAMFLLPEVKAEVIAEKTLVKAELKAGVQEVKATEKAILHDDAKVVRGGTNTPEQIAKGTGTHPSGHTGVSVECGNCSVKELAKPLPHNKIGVTTVGDVRKAGGDVIKTSGASSNHATMTGLSPEKASELLNPVIKNPNK